MNKRVDVDYGMGIPAAALLGRYEETAPYLPASIRQVFSAQCGPETVDATSPDYPGDRDFLFRVDIIRMPTGTRAAA